MRIWKQWMVVSACIFSGVAMAQSNLGELLDMGARQIQKDELVSLLSGLTMSGESFTTPGATIRFDYLGDGTVSGYSRTATGQESRSTGKWTVDDSGKFCRAMTRQNGQRWGDCRYFFMHADTYFAAETNDRATKIEKRIFEKK